MVLAMVGKTGATLMVNGGRLSDICMRPENDLWTYLSATGNILQSLVTFVSFSIVNARICIRTNARTPI